MTDRDEAPDSEEQHQSIEEGSTQQAATGFLADKVEACEAAVEAYRRGDIPKQEATYLIFSAIQLEREFPTPSERDKYRRACITFIGQLDDVDKGNTREEVARRTPEADHPGSQTQASRSSRASHTNTAQPSGLGGGHILGKRARADVFGGDVEEEEGSSSRRPIDEALIPFLNGGRHFKPPESLSERELTLLLKDNYIRDISLVKQCIICHPDCPEVPDTVWPDIIANRFVDLDKIFSSMYSLDGDGPEKFKIGELELISKSAKLNKKISEHGDWTLTWVLYQQAVLFLYPHRDGELREYYTFVNGLFASLPSTERHRAINFDRAVRSEVSKSNRKTLADVSSFSHVYTRHITFAGGSSAGSSSASSPKRARSGKSNEPCMRWNDGKCTRSAADCRYKHVCAKCKSSRHVENECQSS